MNNVLKTLVTYCAEETLVATAGFEEYQSELNLITNAETLFGNQYISLASKAKIYQYTVLKRSLFQGLYWVISFFLSW